MNKDSKILVVEYSDHYMNLEQLSFAFKGYSNMIYLFKANEDQKYWTEHFPSHIYSRVLVLNSRRYLLSQVWFRIRVLREAMKADLIFISTFPEYDHLFFLLLDIPFFYLFGKKIVSMVRNPITFAKDQAKERLSNFVRRTLIFRVKILIFENQSAKKYYEKNIESQHEHLIMYGKFSDKLTTSYSHTEISKKLTIGLLGTLSYERRDYGLLYSSLDELPNNLRKRITFVILGAQATMESNDIIANLSERVNILKVDSAWLTEDLFSQLGQECQILMAPLTSEKNSKKGNYGNGNSTGAFADAIYFNKLLVVPEFSDPEKEFKNFCLYYSNVQELSKILSSIERPLQIKKNIFSEYTSRRFMEQLGELLDD